MTSRSNGSIRVATMTKYRCKQNMKMSATSVYVSNTSQFKERCTTLMYVGNTIWAMMHVSSVKHTRFACAFIHVLSLKGGTPHVAILIRIRSKTMDPFGDDARVEDGVSMTMSDFVPCANESGECVTNQTVVSVCFH